MNIGPTIKPTRAELIAILTGHYRVSEVEAIEWIRQFVCGEEKR